MKFYLLKRRLLPSNPLTMAMATANQPADHPAVDATSLTDKNSQAPPTKLTT